jgi:hypothetical protein
MSSSNTFYGHNLNARRLNYQDDHHYDIIAERGRERDEINNVMSVNLIGYICIYIFIIIEVVRFLDE